MYDHYYEQCILYWSVVKNIRLRKNLFENFSCFKILIELKRHLIASIWMYVKVEK